MRRAEVASGDSNPGGLRRGSCTQSRHGWPVAFQPIEVQMILTTNRAAPRLCNTKLSCPTIRPFVPHRDIPPEQDCPSHPTVRGGSAAARCYVACILPLRFRILGTAQLMHASLPSNTDSKWALSVRSCHSTSADLLLRRRREVRSTPHGCSRPVSRSSSGGYVGEDRTRRSRTSPDDSRSRY